MERKPLHHSAPPSRHSHREVRKVPIKMASGSVLFYVPNIIGYVRLILVVFSWCFYAQVKLFLPFYCTAVFLDCIDGFVARKLKQTSEFGAWLDVFVDNIGRSVVWFLLPYKWGVFVVCLEWTVFVCTHTAGHTWKKNNFDGAPWWVKSVMENGFYTCTGFLTISGLHGLPVYLYIYRKISELYVGGLLQYDILLGIPIAVLGIGRAICAAVELWCIANHISRLLNNEADHQVNSLTADLEKIDSNSPDS